ncbi:diablo, IAP-binding mitochondrial protein a [Betta splendens]|uniref:Direct IAP-binding protein with low pI n=1 Tax=Betta splendens TaxID=158456 RepID=A0A6P7PDH2_BETSP|nr:diablo, IAP-binding mitochondrial protein a [Betta splendens]
MATLKRGAVFFSFLRSTARVLSGIRTPAVCKAGRWTKTLNATVASLAVGAGLCAVPFTQVEHLSHDSLVKRAASLVTDSSSTFLSQTTLALIDATAQYSKAVHTLIALQKRYLASLGKLTPTEEDSIWQVIIGQRAKVNDKHEECKRFELTWTSAVRLCEMAAEAAYTSGAEHASVTMRTNIHLAQSQVEEAQKLAMDAEQKMAETKVMEVERMTQYAASLEKNDEVEEVPEAYLRED